MIYVFGLHGGLNQFRFYLALAGAAPEGVRIFENCELISYHDVLGEDRHRFFPGAHIFTDLLHLQAQEIERLGLILGQLRASPLDVLLLNDPLTFPSRYELLRRLHEDGTNDHNVYHVTERRAPARWPVFLRHESGHWHSDLLCDAGQLEACLESMARKGVWHGNKLIVEFNDTRRADGYFRRDSAFRIGARIVPWRIIVARRWWLRRSELDPSDFLEERAEVAEQMAYLSENPHEAELMEIFERVDVQFGRIDYAVKDGRIQVWEINASPLLPKLEMYRVSPAAQPVLNLACQLLFDAFAGLDGTPRP